MHQFIRFCNNTFEIAFSHKLRRRCRYAFDRREKESNFWEWLDLGFKSCICEQVSVSRHSPGKVRDDEKLVPVITSHSYVAADGTLLPTIFDQRIKTGMSVDRRDFTNRAEFDERAKRLVSENPSKRQYLGAVSFSAKAVRQVFHNGVRCFGVYDTALSNNAAHAEIAQTEEPALGAQDRKAIRARLRKSLLAGIDHGGKVVSSSVAFDG